MGAIVLAAGERRLSVRMILESCDATARTTSFIGFILFGAYILNYILSSLGLPQPDRPRLRNSSGEVPGVLVYIRARPTTAKVAPSIGRSTTTSPSAGETSVRAVMLT